MTPGQLSHSTAENCLCRRLTQTQRDYCQLKTVCAGGWHRPRGITVSWKLSVQEADTDPEGLLSAENCLCRRLTQTQRDYCQLKTVCAGSWQRPRGITVSWKLPVQEADRDPVGYCQLKTVCVGSWQRPSGLLSAENCLCRKLTETQWVTVSWKLSVQEADRHPVGYCQLKTVCAGGWQTPSGLLSIVSLG